MIVPSGPSVTGKKARDWRDLRPRLLSALVLIVVALVAITAGGYVYGLLIVAVMAGMASEGAALFGLTVRSWRGALFVAWSGCAGVAAFFGHWLEVPAFVMTAWLFGPALWLMTTVIVAAGTALMWLRLGDGGGIWPVVFVIALVVLSDSTAYATGRMVGGPKLAPRISPGKTRSGALGGLCGAVLAGVVVAWLEASGNPAQSMDLSALLWHAAVWAVPIGVAAQAGDLAESAVKRARGVKDSGTLLPGHGGLLDRFDALMAAAPLAALLSLAARPGLPFWSVGLGDLVRSVRGLWGA